MLRTRAWIVTFVLASASCGFADPAEELAALEKRLESSSKGRRETYLELRPEFEAFAKKHAGTQVGLKAKLWILQNTWWLRDDKGTMEDAAAPVADEILRDYGTLDDIAKIAEWSYVFRKEKHAELLAALMAEGRPGPVRAAAGFANAVRVKRASGAGEARPLFEALVKDFGALKKGTATYASLADAHLNTHDPSGLKIGKPAPEIEGVSAEGKPMKLSDYRGRVVVLNFFGDW